MARVPLGDKLSHFFRSRDGNFAMMAAILAPVVFVAGSLAVDTTNALTMKTRLQNAVDSAALATASRLYQEGTLSIVDAKAFAKNFLHGQIEDDKSAFANFAINPKVTITPTYSNGATLFQVSIQLTGTMSASPMARLIGRETMDVTVSGSAQSGTESKKSSVSMALVLDRSGSMGWKLDGEKKIKTLKTAVFGLIDEFKTVDPKQEFVRLGAASYNSTLSGKELLNFKINKVHSFTGGLKANGGTDSTDAFAWGYLSLKDPREVTEHLVKTGQPPKKIIVFMTDGDNNYYSADTSTKILCDRTKTEDITIYSVAFAAPDRGKKLLSYCATSSDHYFDAQNSADLIAAFKNIGQQSSKVVSRLTD